MPLIECVPNFSDGRDALVGEHLRGALTRVQGVRLLGWHADPDHNRSVATLVGEPEALVEAGRAAIEVAARDIDLRAHVGVHPRLGATDVCPFVPLRSEDMPDCVRAAHLLGERVARELSIPVYYYGEAALSEERRALPDVRRGGFEGLREAVRSDPTRRPDAGPRALHPRAGAIAIGARTCLVAFNVDLESRDLALARAIAGAIREANGGLPGVRALGFELATQGCVQVSVNLCAPERTGLREVYAAIERLASVSGVRVRRSELVGLAPRAVLDAEVAREVRLTGFEALRHVLEEAVAAGREIERVLPGRKEAPRPGPRGRDE
jgi:glutamate formiminotransferase/glutamate formiminotransferase/formiminotetrahydrofolate cyclodeaminase